MIKAFAAVLKKIIYFIFYKLGVKKRLLLFFSVIIILPLLSVSIISYFRFSSYAVKKTLDYKMEVTESALKEILSNKIRDEKLSDQILSSFRNRLIVPKPQMEPYDEILDFNAANETLATMREMVNVNAILVMGEEGQYYSSGTDIIRLKSLEVFKDSIKYDEISHNNLRNVWVPLFKDVLTYQTRDTERPFLYVIRKVDQKQTRLRSVKGSIILQLRPEGYFDVMGKTLSEKGEFSVLIDHEGILLADTKDNKRMGEKLDREIFEKLQGDQGAFDKTVDKVRYLIQYTRNSESGWSILQFIPYDNILAKSREIRNFTLLVMGIFLVVALLLSMIFSKNMSDPVIRMTRAMDTFGEGNLKFRIKNDREDEFGHLYESFNTMTEEIQVLLQRIDENNRQRRRLELNILEYQINPHFLYNTLESINWMAQKSGHAEIGEIVSALARYFRIGLSKGKEMIKISEELEHVNNYLIIYQFRYMGCFQFSFEVEESILSCKTVKLILQPLVENAIKYGVNKNDDKGFIKISGRREGEFILLEVEDNGAGIEESKLVMIQKMLDDSLNPEDYTGGIGLMNVSQRIRLTLGEAYGITIQSQIGSGTKVGIRLPVLH